jgi:hypothetical protein
VPLFRGIITPDIIVDQAAYAALAANISCVIADGPTGLKRMVTFWGLARRNVRVEMAGEAYRSSRWSNRI